MRSPCRDKANQIAREFLAKLPALRESLALDAQAAYDGDPAAKSKVLQVLGWSVPYPLDQKYAEEAGNVVDLVARYAPTPLSVQIERFGEVPVKREPQTDQSAPQNPQY